MCFHAWLGQDPPDGSPGGFALLPSPLPSSTDGPAGSGARGLAGTVLYPPALEAEFRASTLRADGRAAAIVVGVITLLSVVFVPNDLLWVVPAGRMAQVNAIRALYVLSSLLVVVVGYRARSVPLLDGAVLGNYLVVAAFTVVLQSTRPADYYLPVILNAIGVLLAFAVVPNRFALQLLSAAAITGACMFWMAAYRLPPPLPVAILVGYSLVVANLAGAFLSWTLHRTRRLQFLAARIESETARALVAVRTRHSELYEGLGDGVVTVGPDGVILEFNETFRRMVGYPAEELRGARYDLLTSAPWHDAGEGGAAGERGAVRERPTAWTHEAEYRRRDGTSFPVEVRVLSRSGDGPGPRTWAIVRDITEERKLRERLGATSRLAAMGSLVAGVAHEINNPLAIAVASHGAAREELEQALQQLQGDGPVDRASVARRLEEAREALDDAAGGERRISAIVKDVVLLGRPDAPRTRVRLANVVAYAMEKLPEPLRERAAIEVPDGGARDGVGAEGQLVQAVVHLLEHAAAAAGGDSPSMVRVRLDPGGPASSVLSVEYHGTGMARDVAARFFEPRFVTRGAAGGTGLGLALCHAIVSAHGGTIRVTSEPRSGAVFRVELPAVEESPASGSAEPVQSAGSPR